MMLPLVDSADRSPLMSARRMPSLIARTSIRPFAFSSVISPCTDFSETKPEPPRTLMSPCVVSTLTSPPTSSIVTSAYMPPTVIAIHDGTLSV